MKMDPQKQSIWKKNIVEQVQLWQLLGHASSSWDIADYTSREARSFSCFLTHLSYASTNTSDITQDVPYNYLEMQIHMNNVYVELVAELKGILKIHSVHAKK